MPVTHTFVSPAPAAPGKVDSVAWNDVHTIAVVDADVDPAAAIAESKLSLNYPTHALVTIGTASGLSLVGQILSLGVASSGVTGALSGIDWDTFNNKQNALGYTPVDVASISWIDLTDGGLTTLHKHQDLNTVVAPAVNILTLTNAAASTLALNITAAKTLTLTSTDNYNLTIPATGTAALLSAQTFTGAQKINVNSTTALFVEQDGVKDNVLIVDTTNGRVGIGMVPASTPLDMPGDTINSTAKFGAFELQSYAVNNCWLADNVYFNGTAFKYRSTGFGTIFYFSAGELQVRTCISGTAGDSAPLLTNAARLKVNNTGDFGIGGSISTNAANYTGALINGNATSKNVGIGTSGAAPSTRLHIVNDSAATATIVNVLTVEQTSTGTAAAGLGAGLLFSLETATASTNQNAGRIYAVTVEAANATRKYDLVGTAFDTAEREGWRIGASGTAAELGFFGVAPVVRPTALTAADAGVVNSGDATTDGVITNIRTRVGEIESKLQSLGLLT